MFPSALSLGRDEGPMVFLTGNHKQGEILLSSGDLTAHSGKDWCQSSVLASAGIGNVVFIVEINPVATTAPCLDRADPSALG